MQQSRKIRKAVKRKAKKSTIGKKHNREKGRPAGVAAYPRHSVKKALRIPKAILEQNAGKACSDREAAKFAGLAYHGPSRVEISSSIKYGLLDRPTDGNVGVTDLAKRILRPQNPNDELDGLRQAVLNAPTVSDVYKHYRGENIPDEQFFRTLSLTRSSSQKTKSTNLRVCFLKIWQKPGSLMMLAVRDESSM